MLTKARIAGHPIHPMLIAFPVALYVTTVVSLIVFVATDNPFWYTAALYANIAGVVMAAVAAIPGLIDLVSLPRERRAARATGFRHAGLNVISLLLFTASAIFLYRNAGVRDVTAPLILSVLGSLSTVAAGWLGWTLVQTHRIGVQEVSDLETDVHAPASHPPMPGTYEGTYRADLRH